MSLIVLEGIRKIYNKNTKGAVCALDEVSLAVDSGEMVAVIGTSGSGKSTLLHILACLDQDFEGVYKLNEKEVQTLSAKKLADIRNKEIGVVLQNFGLIYDMSVFDNVAMPVYLSGERFSGKELSRRVLRLLEALDLTDKIHTKTSQLSGGQKQRVAIARALIHDPSLILADEPTGALDGAASVEIMNILSDLNSKGKTVILVTHDMAVAQRCKRIITISDGRIVRGSK